jgi:hypothetical protein
MFMQNTSSRDASSQYHVTYVVTRYPYTDKPVPAPMGTGLLGLGYGLARKTPGLPVENPIWSIMHAQLVSSCLYSQLHNDRRSEKIIIDSGVQVSISVI